MDRFDKDIFNDDLRPPNNEADYDRLVQILDELLSIVGDDENHPLAEKVSRIGDLIEYYDRVLPRLPE